MMRLTTTARVMDDGTLRRLGDAAATVATGLELDAVLQNVVDVARRLLDARYAALGVIGDDDGLATFVHAGFDGDVDRVGHLPSGRGILGVLIQDPRPLRLADLTTHEQSYGFPDGHPTMRSFVGVPIRVRSRVYGNLYVTEKRGAAEFDQDDQDLALALAATAGAAIDNAFLYRRTRQRERTLEALREVTGAMLRGLGRQRILQLIAARARELVSADLAVICVPQRVGADAGLFVAAAAGTGADALVGSVQPTAGSLSHEVMRTGQMVATDTVPGELAPGMTADRDVMAIGAPLMIRDEPYGALALAAGDFDEGARQLTEMFADQASVILDHTRVKDELERLLLIEERERIGRDLHDSVIQRLFATGLELQALAARLEPTEHELAGRLAKTVDQLDDTILQIRTSIFALRPSGLVTGDDQRVPALRVHEQVVDVLAESSRALGFEPELTLAGGTQGSVPTDVAEHLLVVVREGLSNVAKHAQATEASVHVEIGDDVVVRVVDNGVGIAARSDGGPLGYGLRNMRERARATGGELELVEGLEGGTVLEWRVRRT